MKGIILACIIFLWGVTVSKAQQKLDPRGMNYLYTTKPNAIIYHDSLFNGAKQFEQLFYRTHDDQLIYLLSKHQSNKVLGQVFSYAGALAVSFGIGALSNNKGLGWGLLGGGLAATITGGYLTIMGQRNLLTAVTLFNQRYRTASLGIGIIGSGAGLVYNF